MFAIDVWLLVAASVAILTATKVLVYARFSIVVLTKAILDGIGDAFFKALEKQSSL